MGVLPHIRQALTLRTVEGAMSYQSVCADWAGSRGSNSGLRFVFTHSIGPPVTAPHGTPRKRMTLRVCFSRPFILPPKVSGLVALGDMRGPGLPGFRLHLGKTSSGRRIGDANEMVTGGTLNLASGVARVALQRLIAVVTVEFEIGIAHRLPTIMRKTAGKSIWKVY